MSTMLRWSEEQLAAHKARVRSAVKAVARPVTQDRLKELFRYAPETGHFTRIVRRGHAPAGAVAGTRHCHGYVSIHIDGRMYLAHRLAWLYVHGEMPEFIDHKNGLKDDNRIDNLRPATHQMNMENFRRPRKDNSSGLLGVHKAKGGYHAKISVKGRTIYLGSFKDRDAAHEAYLNAKRRLHEGGTL